MPCPEQVSNTNITLITLLGDWPLQHEWVPVCIDSWYKIVNVGWPGLALSDSLNDLCQRKLDALESITPLRAVANQEEIVSELIRSYPAISHVRNNDLTWRKIIDTIAVTKDLNTRVLLIDTDVLIRRSICLPVQGGIHYLREDIPAYRAKALFPLKERIVDSFNAGFVLFDPCKINLAEIEIAAAKYFYGLKNYWWTEQACWAFIAGKSSERFFFDGSSACVLSGLRTRTPGDVRQNRVCLFSSKHKASPEYLVRQAGVAPVVHMSGMAKYHWRVLSSSVCTELEGTRVEPLLSIPDPLIGPFRRLLIAARLFGINAISSIKELKLPELNLLRRTTFKWPRS
jgi:hypothetical protein